MTNKIKIVCGQCAVINQLPEDRLGVSAICGICKVKLFHGRPVEVNDTALAKHIQHSSLPVLVDFWAPWCGPCKVFAPIFASYASKYAQSACCLKLNTEDNQQAGLTFQIRSIPTLVIFKYGKEIDRISGAMNEAQLVQWVRQAEEKVN